MGWWRRRPGSSRPRQLAGGSPKHAGPEIEDCNSCVHASSVPARILLLPFHATLISAKGRSSIFRRPVGGQNGTDWCPTGKYRTIVRNFPTQRRRLVLT